MGVRGKQYGWQRVVLTAGSALLCVSAVLGQQSASFAPPPDVTLPVRSASNPYNDQLKKWQAAFNESAAAARADVRAAPAAVVLLRRIYGLRELVDDPAELARWMQTVADAAGQQSLVRDEALYLLALEDAHSRRLASAETRLEELGFVRDWSLVGPFAAPDGLASQFGPESGFRPEAAYRDSSGRARRWISAPAAGPYAWVELADFFPRPGPAVAFACTSVFAESAQDVAIRLGADAAIALYVNGARVLADEAETGFAFDQRVIAAHLERGWNTLLVKLYRSTGGPWRLAARVTAPAGGGAALKVDPLQAGGAFAGQASSSRPAPALDLLAVAQAAAQNAGSAENLEILGELERVRGRGSLVHLERAARLESTADRWLAVARACGDESCSLSALSSALRKQPGHSQASLALADHYAARGQLQKARNLLRAAVAANPADFVLRKRLADVYGSAGLNSAALAEYRRLEQEFPSPAWLKRELAARYESLGSLDDALRLTQSAMQTNFDGQRERDMMARMLERRRDSEALRSFYGDSLLLDPRDSVPLSRLAKLEAGAGQFDRALAHLRTAISVRPEDEQLRLLMAETLSQSGRDEQAGEYLNATLNAYPGMEQVRARVELTSGARREADPDLGYLANAAELAAEAQAAPPDEWRGWNAVTLADVRIQRVQENGLSTVRAQQVFYIATDQGAREYATRSVQYAHGSQELQVLAARAYKRDGRIIEAEDAGEGSVGDAAVAMYYDGRSRVLRFPGLEKGDVLELDYRILPASSVNAYGDYFGDLVVFQVPIPQKLKRYVLVTPASRRFSVLEERMPTRAMISGDAGRRIYRWEARDIPALPSEPRGPALTEVAPYVHVSTFASWQDLGRWYSRLIAPQFELDAALREALPRILAGKKTDQEKISAIHQFVLRNTHYVALEFGVYGYKPYPVSQVYARRFGDCKDKASLMIALLRAAGIPAEIALVRTRRLGDIAERATSIAVFNHAVVYVPSYNLWLDGTAEYAGSRELPLDDQGALALTVAADGAAQLRRIPVTLPMQNYTHRQVQARIQRDGTVLFTGSAYARGEDAPGLRRQYEIAERQRDALRNNLAELFPSVNVDSVQVDGTSDLERDVTVKFKGTLDTFAGRPLVSLTTSWIPRSYVQTLAPLNARSEDLLLPAPWTTEEELHFELPQNARVDAVPQDKVLDTPFGSANLRYELRDRELVVKTFVQFRKLRITPEEYDEFRSFCSRLEKAFRGEIKVVLRG